MDILREISPTRDIVRVLKSGGTLGLVPTMGNLHEGHLSLMDHSRSKCDFTAVSIFVNPTQFGEGEDFKIYPRDEERDLALCEEHGVDFVFLPDVSEMYPGNESVFVDEQKMSKVLCGKERPTHFRGVLTVVAKLLNIVQPDVAYFGLKDYQQGILIKRMCIDLNFPVRVELLPIVREVDGLAMSSRNTYLSTEDREQAVVLSESLKTAQNLYANGERDCDKIRKAVLEKLNGFSLADTGYVEIRDVDSLEEIETIDRPVVLATAVRFGETRLIDNTILGCDEEGNNQCSSSS